MRASAPRLLLAILFLVAGLLHFVRPGIDLRIMPTSLPRPLLLVYISGACEMLGGAGLLLPCARRIAASGLVALLIAVWPANLNMALHPHSFPGIPAWVLWTRLPLQIPLILWAGLYARRPS